MAELCIKLCNLFLMFVLHNILYLHANLKKFCHALSMLILNLLLLLPLRPESSGKGLGWG